MKEVHRFDARLNQSLRAVVAYAEAHSTPLDPLLHELDRETHLKTLAPQMMSGLLQGQFLRLLSMIQGPRRILEVGTFTGYGTLCLAAGLTSGGHMDTVEVNDELAWIIRKYLRKAGLEEQVALHLGDAMDLLPTLPGPYDLVFLDAGKHDYIRHYELVMEKVNPGGLILADNVLWSGKVVEKPEDPDARLLHQFNEHVQRDERVENVLLPLRDGLMIARKR